MKNILAKLALIQSDIETMPKDGWNDFNKYKYLSETQITLKMKQLLDKHGVLFSYSSELIENSAYTTGKGETGFMTIIRVPYKFIDVASGEALEGSAVGAGADRGDKGIYKAITGAIKYIYMKSFNIPTGDDAEKDSPDIGTRLPDGIAHITSNGMAMKTTPGTTEMSQKEQVVFSLNRIIQSKKATAQDIKDCLDGLNITPHLTDDEKVGFRIELEEKLATITPKNKVTL